MACGEDWGAHFGIPCREMEKKDEAKDEEGTVEDAKEDEEKKLKTKKVDKTTWEWELCNQSKPIGTLKPVEN